MFNSFLIKSARTGPTPFRYSMGVDSMLADTEIENVLVIITKLAT